jgi:hypothetical protein
VSPAPTLHPALPWSVDALILEALAERLRRDAPLRTVLADPWSIVIVERRAVLALETLSPPLLALSLFADREGRGTSSYGAEQETIVEIALLTAPPTTLADHAEHLRSRLVARIRAVIRQHGGELHDADGRVLATAQTAIGRVNFDEAALPSLLVLTLLRVTFKTDLDLLTQELIP